METFFPATAYHHLSTWETVGAAGELALAAFQAGEGGHSAYSTARKQFCSPPWLLSIALCEMLAKICLNDSFARSNLSNWFSLISCLWDCPHASHDFLKCIHCPKLILFKHVDWIWTVFCIWSPWLQNDWQIIIDQIYHMASLLFLDCVKTVLDVKDAQKEFSRCLAPQCRHENRTASALTSCVNYHRLACTGSVWIPVNSITRKIAALCSFQWLTWLNRSFIGTDQGWAT